MTRKLGVLALVGVLLTSVASAQVPGGDTIVVGSTPIQKGTDTWCLYDNAGKVGLQVCGSGTAAGVDKNVQFNDNGVFAGFGSYSKATGVLTLSPSAPSSAGGDILNFNSAAVAALPTVPHTNSSRIIGADNQDAAQYIDSFGPNDGSLLSARSIVNLRAARGTGAALLASNSGDELARISGRGGLAGAFTNSVASVSFIAAENFTSTNQGALVGFRTTALGTPGQGTNATPPLVGAFGPSGTLIVGKGVTLGSLTASISGSTMTVTAQSGTALAVGQFIDLSAAGVTDAEIVALGSGVGSTGTYTVAPGYGTVTSLSTTAYKFFAVDAANDTGAGWGNFQSGVALSGSTSGRIKMAAPAVAGTNQITWPAGTTDFSATGGTTGAAPYVVKQASAGAALTVGAPAGWITLKQVNVEQTVVTGTTTKTNSFTFTVPGGTLGLNGRLKITPVWRFTGANGTKTIGVDFGGTTFWGPAAGVAGSLSWSAVPVQIANRNSLSSQIATSVVTQTSTGGSLSDVPTGSVNTAADQTLALWVTLANGSDTGAVESVMVEYNNDAP